MSRVAGFWHSFMGRRAMPSLRKTAAIEGCSGRVLSMVSQGYKRY